MSTDKTKDPEKRFILIEKIGHGSFGEVYKAMDKCYASRRASTGDTTKAAAMAITASHQQPPQTALVAIKIIDLDKSDDDIDEIQKEIFVLSKCDCQYVVKHFGSYLVDTKLWIVMEYMSGGSVLDLMRPRGSLEETYVAIILREVLKGLEYLHSSDESMIHRDVKAANILLSERGDVKLADFGVAKQLSQSVAKSFTLVGTPLWMAPEVIRQNAYDISADIWSLGITALEMANGSPPHANMKVIKALILIPKSAPPRLEGSSFSKSFRDFVECVLQKDPKSRPSAKELLKHSFIKKAKRNAQLVEVIERYKQWCLDESEKEIAEIPRCYWKSIGDSLMSNGNEKENDEDDDEDERGGSGDEESHWVETIRNSLRKHKEKVQQRAMKKYLNCSSRSSELFVKCLLNTLESNKSNMLTTNEASLSEETTIQQQQHQVIRGKNKQSKQQPPLPLEISNNNWSIDALY